MGWQQIRDRGRKLDLATLHHVREQDSGEHLGHGTDLEHAVTSKRECVWTRVAVSKHAPGASFIHQSDDDPSDAIVLHQLLEHRVDR